MKLIKKIAAIMFAFMMVVSMSCNVKANDTTTPTEKGTITINKAVNEQTYTIYKLLDLESYDATKNHYSYKPATEWKSFFETAEAKNYITVDENGYANWVKGADQVAFAQKALSYATTNKIGNKGTAPASNNTVTFDNLDLGYYLVDSSVGALCLLDTTNPTVTIEEKNGVPTVEKTIEHGGKIDNTKKSNSANIGETIAFETKINVSNGAKKYVLHDKMDSNLKLFIPTEEGTGPVHITANKSTVNPVYNTDYFVDTNISDSCKCTFHVRFSENYLNKIDDTVVLTCNYFAKLLDSAEINKEMVNQTWLTYGENNTESNKPQTKTYTFGIPVFKYTGTEKTALAGAKFRLHTDEQCKDENIVKVKTNGTDYIVGDSDENENVMTSPATTGKFNINGLKAGTYYLKEIEAPKGYNKLANAIKVEITNDGKVQVEKPEGLTTVDKVEVENKSGTVLPSTGGAGTTMIYLIGAVLVLGSGVVLVTKRRVKGK